MKTQEMPTQQTSSSQFDLKRILVPVDFSDASRKAVEIAQRVSGLTGADLIFLHVIEPDGPVALESIPSICSDELKENAEENLRFLVQASRKTGDAGATSIMRYGIPTHEVVEEAKDSDVDLIVIATHGHTGWKHFCIGSTTERVVRSAPCPVLVVREKEHEFCYRRSRAQTDKIKKSENSATAKSRRFDTNDSRI